MSSTDTDGEEEPELSPRRVRFAIRVVLGVVIPGASALLAARYGTWLFLSFAALALGIAAFTLFRAARSLFIDEPLGEVVVQSGRRRKELEREKAALMKALKELEFDHEMGKVSDEDFAEIGGQYRARTIRVMRQLDDRHVDYARLVEEELARRGVGRVAPAVAQPGATASATPELAAKVAVPSQQRCARCGTSNDADAVFCKKCAAALKDAS